MFEAWTSRGARDRFTLISRRLKAKNAQELKGTGGGGEQQTEYELLLEEMIQPSDESDKKTEAEAETVRENTIFEKQKALDIRKRRAMETMGQRKNWRSDGVDENKLWPERKKAERERQSLKKWHLLNKGKKEKFREFLMIN